MELTAGVTQTSELTPARSGALERILAWLTVERALYAIALAAAVVFRLFELGRLPLDPSEAATAWPAWLAANGLTVANAPTPASALLHTLLSSVMWFGAAGDALMRFPSVLAGIGLVVVAWRLRDWLGRPCALAFALLVAIDPWTTALSRMVSGSIPAVLLLLALGACISWSVRARDSAGEPSGPGSARSVSIIGGVCAGLLLTCGPAAWTAVPIAALWLLLYRRELAAANVAWATGARSAAGTAIAVSTMLLTQAQGLGQISHSLTLWIDAFSDGGRGVAWFGTQLLADEFPLLIGGLIGLIGLARFRQGAATDGIALRDRRWAWLLFAWLAWSALVAALSGSVEALAFVAVPLLFGAAYLAGRVVRMPPPEMDWREAIAVVVTLTVLLTSGAFWMGALLSETKFAVPAATALVSVLALALVIGYLYVVWAGRDPAAQVLTVQVVPNPAQLGSQWETARQEQATQAQADPGALEWEWEAAEQERLAHARRLEREQAQREEARRAQATWLFGAYGIVLMALLTINRSWQLSHVAGIDLPSALVQVQTNPEVRQLARDVKTLSAHIAGDDGEIPVVLDMMPSSLPGNPLGPVLGWYLRGMRRLTWYDMSLPDGARLYITSGQAVDAQGNPAPGSAPENYRGSAYRVTSSWTPGSLRGPLPSAGEPDLGTRLQQWWSVRLRPQLRWIVYRETRTQPEAATVILWAPANEY